MFKRRDWLHLHGAECASDSSDEDSSSGDSHKSDEDASSSELNSSDDSLVSDREEGRPDFDGFEANSDDGINLGKRLEDISEDDMSDNDWDAVETQQELEEQLERWVTATGAAAEKGRPLKCRLCHGKLILNAKALRQHLESRKHEKRVDKAEAEGLDAGDDFCFAEDYQQDDGETHQERMERITKELEQVKQEQQQQQEQTKKISKKRKKQKSKAGTKSSGPEKEAAVPSSSKLKQQQPRLKVASQPEAASQGQHAKDVKGEQPQGAHPRKRPGKRQREQLKQDGSLPPKMNAAARRKERRKQQQKQSSKNNC